MFEHSLVTSKPKLSIPQRLLNVAVQTGLMQKPGVDIIKTGGDMWADRQTNKTSANSGFSVYGENAP